MINKNEIIQDLFHSKKRKLIDSTLLKIIQENTDNDELKNNILYHLGLDNNTTIPTLGHTKRLRPYLCLLFAEEMGYDLKIVLPGAVSVELIHNATLIVDDIQDDDQIRCNKLALWKKTNIAEAMNVAFYLSTLSISYFHKKRIDLKLADYSDLFILHLNKLSSGQQIDISIDNKYYTNTIDNNQKVTVYEKMVDGKTGSLIFLSCILGASPHEINHDYMELLIDFCYNLARLHQLQDDLDDLPSIKDINNLKKVSIEKSNIMNFFKIDNKRLNKDEYIKSISFLNEYYELLLSNLQTSIAKLFDHKIIKTNKLLNLVEVLTTRNNSFFMGNEK